MEYYDWLIISFALIMIGFLTLLGLAIFETSLKNKNWVLWFSIGGLILFVFLTGFTIWYFKGKGSNKRKKEIGVNGNQLQGENNIQEPRDMIR